MKKNFLQWYAGNKKADSPVHRIFPLYLSLDPVVVYLFWNIGLEDKCSRHIFRCQPHNGISYYCSNLYRHIQCTAGIFFLDTIYRAPV